ncbi:unnamed protein product [Acanthoscelides obtectus]|uniref:Uncharacterized protein n=1 Tax=Acanthoscelides obtectus TaxID=200917 RepID=A0A9P0PNF5_ACAOB|nr:unnamed protein product [Acanthoscelides obtectus]CAK1630860.1 hypothetical protein AOBTE_LOCUS6595 [Acanthoscelides obtectus]
MLRTHNRNDPGNYLQSNEHAPGKKEEHFRSSGTSGTEQDGSPIVEGSPIPKFNFFDLIFPNIVVRLTIRSQTLLANLKMRRFLV